MPLIPNLTPELKREILRLKGLSPEQGYDVLDTGQIVRNPNPQPSVDVNSANSVVTTGNKDVLSPKPPGSLESFGRAAATSTIPTFTAFGAVAATPAIAAAIAGAPLTGGASLLLPILAGVGTAAGASYLQDKLVPESVKQQLFTRPEDIAENPKATFAGGLAPSALAFNPVRSLGDVRTLVSGAKKLPTLAGVTTPGTIPLTTQEVIALQNAGINAGISVAQEGYEQLAHDDFSPGRLAANAIAPTLLFTRPTKLGQRVFGFHDIPEGPMYGRTEAQAPAQGEPLPPAESAQYSIPPEVTQSGYIPGGVLIQGNKVIPLASVKKDFKPGDIIRYKDPQTGKTVEYIINEDYQRVPQYQPEDAYGPIDPRSADDTIVGTPKPRKHAPSSAEVIEASVVESAKLQKLNDDLRAAQLRGLEARPAKSNAEYQTRQRQLLERQAQAERELTAPLTEAEIVEQEYAKGIRRSEASALPPEESPVGPRFGSTPVREYPPEVQAAFKRLEELEAEVRGIKLQRETQGPGLGLYEQPVRTTSLRPTYAGDIAGHETIGHGYILDMLASRSKADRDFTWRGIREFSEVPTPKTIEEFAALPDAERARIEEGIAKALGIDSFNRKKLELYGTKRERFLNWWADARSALRYRMDTAEPSDVLRSLGFGGKYAAPYGTRPEFMPRTAAELAAQGGTPVGAAASARQQTEGAATDAARMARVSALSEKGRALEEQGMTFDQNAPTELYQTGSFKIKTPKGKIVSKLFYDKESPTETKVDFVHTDPEYRGKGYAETLYRELANTMQKEGATDLTGNLISDKAAGVRERTFGEGEYTASGKPVSFEEAQQILRDKPTMVKARHRVDPNARYSEKSALGNIEQFGENQPRAYGHWIAPDGTMHRVEGAYGHISTARAIAEALAKTGHLQFKNRDFSSDSLSGSSDAQTLLYQEGWARGVHGGPNDYGAATEYGNSLTPKQIKALKDYGIEREARIGDESSNRPRMLYDPAEGERYSQESALGPSNEPIRGTDYDTTRPLYLTASKVLSSRNELGLNPTSKFPQYQLNATLKSKLPPVEYEMLQEAGLDKFLAESKSLTPKELQTWIEENGPRVNIVSYGMAGKASPAKQALDRMTHEWYDNLDGGSQAAMYKAERIMDNYGPDAPDIEKAISVLSAKDYEQAKKYLKLKDEVANEPRDTSPRATSFYNEISAFDANERMPDWTTSKDSRNVQRVDIVLPSQYEPSRWLRADNRPVRTLADTVDAQITGGKSELWRADDLHEKLPNTLGWAMLQYKTGPNGEKIAALIEGQSRWAQEARRLGVKSKKSPLIEYAEYLDEQLGNKKVDYSSVPEKSIRDVIDANKSFLEIKGRKYKSSDEFFKEISKRIEGHPLLKDYNRLIVKAAIDQARKEGATHFMISDAETVMMTEKHDAVAGKVKPLLVSELEGASESWLNNKFGSDWRDGKYVEYDNIPFRVDKPESNGGMYDSKSRAATAKELQPYADTGGFYIPQEGGMRFNYDKQLPKIAEELLGSKGERVSLGEHKNAYNYKPTEREQRLYDYGNPAEFGKIRKDLVFQNPDGTPKTDVSGRMYSLEGAPEKFSLTSKRFSEESALGPSSDKPIQTDTPEFRRWFGESKVVDKDGQPLVVYHGTSKDQDFSKFNKKQTGIWFTDSTEQASSYAKENDSRKTVQVPGTWKYEEVNTSSRVYPVYLNIENPLKVEGDILKKWRSASNYTKGNKELISYAKRMGHDGLDFNNGIYVAFEPTQVKSATGNIGTFDPTNPDIRYSTGSALPPSTDAIPERTGRRSFTPLLTSRFDKVAERHPNETGRYVSDAFHKWQAEADLLEGRIGNKAIALIKDYTPEEVQRVDRLRHALTIGEPAPYTLTANERRLKDAMDAHYRDVGRMHQDSGMLVRTADGEFRRMVLNEQGYRPSLLSNEVAYTWAENIQPKAREYDQMFVDHAMRRGETEESARNLLQDYKQAIGHAGATPDVKFGALRKVEGMGLPWELVDQNYTSMASRYGRRAAADLSFFKNVQNDPKMLAALPIRDQQGKLFRDLPQDVKDRAAGIEYIGGSEEVKQALRSVYGIDLPANPRLMSAARAVGSMVMQTGTGIRNLLQIPPNIAPYYGVDIITGLKALAKMNERTARAFENNAIRSSFKDFDAAGDFSGNPIRFIRYADKISEFLRKYTGRELSDKIEGLYHYSLGEELATKWFAQAKNRDIKARQMIKRFGNTLEKPVADYFNPATEVTADDIARVAKSFVDAARGTYSASGLPGVAIEGNVAPFLALSRWSIERSNIFWRDVVEPMKGGDFMPLLKTTFAAMLTGAAIEQLNEALTGKRGIDPTIKEALADGDADTLTAKAIGLAQLGSYAGIVSDAAKVGTQLAQGKSIRYTNPLSMPMASVGVDVANRTAQVAKAIREGEDPFEALSLYVKDLALATSQNARYAYANLTEGGREEAERKEKFRDLRVFEEMTGRREGSSFTETNPYLGLGARNFKRSDDIAEALQMVPDLVQQAVEKSQDDNGQLDIEILRRKLRALKLNSYQTVPDALKNPRAFTEFMDFLSKTQGPEAATERAADFYRQRAINKMKSSTIPSF
jgi:GNAT superfamily N-acetyltransferase